MKRVVFALTIGFLLISIPSFAADGDLIVNGKVGIGTISPEAALDVYGRGYFRMTNNSVIIRSYRSGNVSYGGDIFLSGDDSLGNITHYGFIAAHIESNTDGSELGGLGFYTMSNGLNYQRIKILANGNVGIGTNAPGSYKLYVNGTMYATVYAGSDLRWKKNIAPINNAMSLVEGLQGVTFEWRKDEFKDKNFEEGRQIGLIAQDVEQVIPEIVKTDEDGYKAIAYEKLTAVLVEALKEQKAAFEAQQAQIKELKLEMERLKAR